MRPERLYLEDMIQAAEAISTFLSGTNRDSFMRDDLVRPPRLPPPQVDGASLFR